MSTSYRVEALYEKAQAQSLQNQFSASLETLRKAVEIAEEQTSPLKAQIDLLMAQNYFAMVQYRDARKICKNGLEYTLNNKLIPEAVQFYLLLGKIHFQQGNFQEAYSTYLESLQIVTVKKPSRSEKELITRLHLALGTSAKEIGVPDKEKHHFLKALFSAQKLKDHGLVAQSLLGLGHYFLNQQKYSMARPLLLKAIKVFRETNNNQGLGFALLHLGQLYTKSYEYRRAVNALKAAYGFFEKLADTINQASALVCLARIFLKIDIQMTETLCHEATDLLVSQPSIQSKRESEIVLGRILVVLGLYYEQKNEMELAKNSVKEGLELFELYKCHQDYQEGLEIYQNMKAVEQPCKNKKSNVLAFKLGMIS